MHGCKRIDLLRNSENKIRNPTLTIEGLITTIAVAAAPRHVVMVVIGSFCARHAHALTVLCY